MSAPISLLIVHDHRMFGEAVELLLTAGGDFEIVGSVATVAEAMEVCDRSSPDVILLGIDLPGANWLESMRALKSKCPDCRALIITAFPHPSVIAQAIEAGASGCIPKSHAVIDLVDSVKRVAAGELVLPSRDLAAVLGELQTNLRVRLDSGELLDRLTDRERQILQAVAKGRSTDEVAATMFISRHTVRGHVKNILSKLQVHSKWEAVTLALRHGLVHIEGLSESRPTRPRDLTG
jgi:DNA-binding NarL/FixJ family response regulator